ncbi:hypothetical protein Clacol_001234 [Clathrus columnatus]|uniref:F-box domain-containing protein n=1 Tax=Clathrus columnatus TaxID=1419009 RepID=A0AAV4ZXV8_9AGAM|nr:hypothetical protein Clacol_001234 [Clathrus columnatus]
MSTQIIPVEIFLAIIESIENRDDLLTLALTCQSLYQTIIPHYLSYFRISGKLRDLEFWKDLSRDPTSCRKVRELKLVEGMRFRYHPDLSDIRKALLQMVDIRRIKFIWSQEYESLGRFFDGLISSKCCLREIDLVAGRVSDSEVERQINELPIWTKLNVTALKKISFQLIWDDTPPQLGIKGMLSNASALTHLSLYIEDDSFEPENLKIFEALTSLKTCYIGGSLEYDNLNQILNVLVRSATDLRKLNLPKHLNGNIRETPFVTLSILRGFSNLTHLFGIWAADLSRDGPDQQKLLAELYYFPQLKYLFPVSYQIGGFWDMTPFRLIRDHNGQLTIKVERNRAIWAPRWGGFYQGMEF